MAEVDSALTAGFRNITLVKVAGTKNAGTGFRSVAESGGSDPP